MSKQSKFILTKTEVLLQQILDEQKKSNILLQQLLDSTKPKTNGEQEDSTMIFKPPQTIETQQV